MNLCCPSCGTTNRVPAERLKDQPECGRCGAELMAARSHASPVRWPPGIWCDGFSHGSRPRTARDRQDWGVFVKAGRCSKDPQHPLARAAINRWGADLLAPADTSHIQ
jgi:hypothetical protein